MENILSLLIGLFTGSIVTLQYDKYKERESDAHIYLLALREIDRFEDEINFWISGYPLGDDAIGKRQLLGTEYINKYLNSKLSTLLPVEPTAEIKHLTEWIYRFNNLLSSLSDEYTLKSKSVIEQIRGDAEAMDTCLQEKKVFIYNALLYTKSKRYLLLNKKPKELECNQKRSIQEIIEIKNKYNII